jgi:hypothetical protein
VINLKPEIEKNLKSPQLDGPLCLKTKDQNDANIKGELKVPPQMLLFYVCVLGGEVSKYPYSSL